jgi:hypothetical protein
LSFYFLLFSGFEIAIVLCFLAHALHSIHQICLLSQKSIAEIGRPLDIVRQTFNDLGQSGQGLHAWIPGLLCGCICQCLVFQILVLFQPLLELDDLQGIGCSCQCLR